MNGLIYERFGILNDYDGFLRDQQKGLGKPHSPKAEFNYERRGNTGNKLFVFGGRC